MLLIKGKGKRSLILTCRPANTEKFLSGSFPGQDRSIWGKAQRATARGPDGPRLRPEAEVEVGFLGRGNMPSAHQLGVNDFSLFWPPVKVSPEQKVSTLNDLSTIFLSFSSHANFESANGSRGFCTQTWVWPASGRSVGKSGPTANPTLYTVSLQVTYSELGRTPDSATALHQTAITFPEQHRWDECICVDNLPRAVTSKKFSSAYPQHTLTMFWATNHL